MSSALKKLPLEKWQQLAKTLKENWPNYACYYYWVLNSIQWKSKDSNISIDIYCPDEQNFGFFVGVSSHSITCLVTFAQEGFENLLYKALTETKLINWSETIYFVGIPSRIIPTIYSVIETLKRTERKNIRLNCPGNYFFKSKEECAAVEICVPDNCYLKNLEESHVPLIHTLWPHRDEKNPEISTKYLKTIIKLNKGIGLFSKENDELFSWIVLNDWSGLGMLQTVENCKRKGYGKIVLNAFAKKLALEGIDSFALVVQGNKPSETMFSSLNWKLMNEVDYIILD